METSKHTVVLSASLFFCSLTMQAEILPYELDKFSQPWNSTVVDTYTKKFDLKDFDRLTIGSAFKINVRPGEGFEVKISGEREYVNEVVAEVRGGELVISFTENKTRLRLKNIVTVDITLPYLRAVTFSGTTTSTVYPGFKSSNFVAYISGTANADITMESKEMYLDVSGAANLKIKGQSEKLKVSTDGTSGLDAFDMPVVDAIIEVSGTSGAKINATETIKADATGAGSIKYKGTAKMSSLNSSRLSSVKKVD